MSGTALLQALQGVLAAAAGGGGAAAAPAPAPVQAGAVGGAPPQHAGTAAAARSGRHGADRHAMTAKPTVPPPAWTRQADSWVLPAGSQPSGAVLPSADAARGAVAATCSKVAGQAVSLAPAGGASGGAGIHLALTPAEPGGSLNLSASAVDAAIARIPAGPSLVLSLQAAWLRAAEVLVSTEAQQPGVADCMRLWQARLAQKAAGVLASDEDDDLFFAGGKHRSAFLQALVGAGHPIPLVVPLGEPHGRDGGGKLLALHAAASCCVTRLPGPATLCAFTRPAWLPDRRAPQETASVAPAFLDAMVCCAAAPAEVALWEGVLRDSFAALRGFSFLDADKAEGPMKRWGEEAWVCGSGCTPGASGTGECRAGGGWCKAKE